MLYPGFREQLAVVQIHFSRRPSRCPLTLPCLTLVAAHPGSPPSPISHEGLAARASGYIVGGDGENGGWQGRLPPAPLLDRSSGDC